METNSSGRLDTLNEALAKNLITFTVSCIINCINGAFVYIYFKNEEFQRDPRYVLYIHLVINDMILLSGSVTLQVLTYTVPLTFTPCCLLLVILFTTDKNSPLNLAGMAVERYVAVCRPLHHVHLCTLQRTYTLIALIWTITFIPILTDILITMATQPPSFFTRPVVCYQSYLFTTPQQQTLSVVVQVVLLSFVFLTLIITYLKVLFAARAVSGSHQASARNARNTILLHGVQLLICMSSFMSPLINVALVTRWPRERTTVLITTFLLTNVLPRLLSPLIYGVRDQTFSRHIALLLSCGNKMQKPGRSRRRSGQQLQR